MQVKPISKACKAHLFLQMCVKDQNSLSFQELVDQLYNFRDFYFETHSIEEAGRKQSDVTRELEKTLKMLEEKEGEC